MTKNYLLIFLFAGLSSFAQPILTSCSPYSISIHSAVPNDNIDLTTAGPNQNWNCSSFILINSLQATNVSVDVNSAAGHEQFPSANFCTHFYSSSFSPPLEYYTFFKITNSIRQILGETNEQGEIETLYTDPQEWILPMQYGDTQIDIHQSTTNPTLITSTVMYDAYGTLTTPYGTFDNVIRIKRVNSNFTNYLWVQVTPNYLPVMERTTSQGETYISLFKDISSLGTTSMLSSNQVIIYPNPASNYLNIKLPNNSIAERAIVIDITGKKIIEITDLANELNLERLEAGLYVIEIFSENRKYQSRFIKN